MARIKLQSEDSGNEQVKDIFDEIIERAGRVPAAYRAFALHPHILQANWNRTKNILGQGNLPIEIKEAIATRVSKVNGCHFCLEIHQSNLEKLGVEPQKAEKIATGEITEEPLASILSFAATATKDPHSLGDEDFLKIRNLGFNDEDILEILTVMEMYTGYNKIIVALGLKPED